MIFRYRTYFTSLVCILFLAGCSETNDCNKAIDFTINGSDLPIACSIVGEVIPFDSSQVAQVLLGESILIKSENYTSGMYVIDANNVKRNYMAPSISIVTSGVGLQTIKLCDVDDNCHSKYINVTTTRRIIAEVQEDPIETEDTYNQEKIEDPISEEEIRDIATTSVPVVKKEPNPPEGFTFCCWDLKGNPIYNKLPDNTTPIKPADKPVVTPVSPPVQQPKKTNEKIDTPIKDNTAVNIPKPSNPITKPVSPNPPTPKPAKPKVLNQEEAYAKMKGIGSKLNMYKLDCDAGEYKSGTYQVGIKPKTYLMLKSIDVQSNSNWKADIVLTNTATGSVQVIKGEQIIDNVSTISLQDFGMVLFPKTSYQLTIRPTTDGSLRNFGNCKTAPQSNSQISLDQSKFAFITNLKYEY